MDLTNESDFFKDYEEKLRLCLENNEVQSLLEKLNIFNKNDTVEENLKKVKEYIWTDLKGEITFIREKAIDNFFECVDFYLKNKDFKRFQNDEYIPDGFIKAKKILPIKGKDIYGNNPLRMAQHTYLGPDRNKYFIKQAEGLKGGILHFKNGKDGRYNPTIAYSIFTYLGEKCAEYLPAAEKTPYFDIVTKNFLEPNQEIYEIQDDFWGCDFNIDENLNIKHSEIIEKIEEAIRKKFSTEISEDKLNEICSKVKLQYAVQETLKKFIESMDQNLGNTAIVATKDDNGKVIDLDISPAYDLDLSLLLGKEMIDGINIDHALYRTTENGEIDLKSIIQEFNDISGYKEKMGEIIKKLDGNYVNRIFDIAYETSKVDMFKSEPMRQKFGAFITRQAAALKEACRSKEEEKDKNKQ